MLAPHDQVCHVEKSQSLNDPEDGINKHVDEMLAERRHGLKISSWEDLWRSLFPGDDLIPPSGMCFFVSPFHRDSDLLTIVDFVPPKVVEIPEVIDAVKKINPEEITSFGNFIAQWGNVHSPIYVISLNELETRLEALDQPTAFTTSPTSSQQTPYVIFHSFNDHSSGYSGGYSVGYPGGYSGNFPLGTYPAGDPISSTSVSNTLSTSSTSIADTIATATKDTSR